MAVKRQFNPKSGAVQTRPYSTRHGARIVHNKHRNTAATRTCLLNILDSEFTMYVNVRVQCSEMIQGFSISE